MPGPKPCTGACALAAETAAGPHSHIRPHLHPFPHPRAHLRPRPHQVRMPVRTRLSQEGQVHTPCPCTRRAHAVHTPCTSGPSPRPHPPSPSPPRPHPHAPCIHTRRGASRSCCARCGGCSRCETRRACSGIASAPHAASTTLPSAGRPESPPSTCTLQVRSARILSLCLPSMLCAMLPLLCSTLPVVCMCPAHSSSGESKPRP